MSNGPGVPPPFSSTPPRADNSILLKMIIVGFLGVMLLIPLGLISGIKSERLGRRNQAVSEITSTWGSQQVIVGPVLAVPYKYRYAVTREEVVDGRMEKRQVEETATATAWFLPRRLEVNGSLDPQVLHRGIYEAVVYNARLNISGSFEKPDFSDWKIAAEDVLWDEASVSLAIPDLRGAQSALSIRWNGETIPLLPGSRVPGYAAGLHASLKRGFGDGDAVDFAVDVDLKGSRGFRVAPVGVENAVVLKSPWPDPSFQGAFLPGRREVGPEGFEAEWNVTFYGRSYPQQWTSREISGFSIESVSASLFGVDLLTLVDAYRLVERAIKYGILFIALVFTGFFLVEILTKLRVHPFQYVLVGVALALFFLVLLSLSEFLAFPLAYAAAAASCTLLIALYSVSILRSARGGLGAAVGIGLIYLFLFVILSLQDYALLVGAAGLFAALAVVMYSTRKVDWYSGSSGAR